MTLSERKKKLLARLKAFGELRVLVVGDVMADHYLWGDVERISPEAPVPVVHVRDEETKLGGATNVASNLHTLGAAVDVCAVVGDDDEGRLIREQLAGMGVDGGGLLVSKERHTTRKTRVIAHNQQVVRVDWEKTAPLSAAMTDRMLARIREQLPKLDAVIVSDYGKGVVNKRLLDGLREMVKKGLIVAVDPKIHNMRYYHGLTTMTPNHHESAQALGIKLDNVDEQIHRAGVKILKRYRLKSLVITRGEEGMSLFEKSKHQVDIPTVAKEVYDVTGAGDTVIAALTCGLAAGANLHQAAQIANFAAGVVIAEVGTASAEQRQVAAAIRGAKDLQ